MAAAWLYACRHGEDNLLEVQSVSREWGRDGIQVTLNLTWLSVPDGLHKRLLSCWDFHTLNHL